MNEGFRLAREWLLLGAESAAATPAEHVVAADERWPVLEERWHELRRRLDTWSVGADPLWLHLERNLGLGRSGAWLALLCGAVEVYPEAAAAASLLAEDERLHLLTPTTLARLLCQAFDISFAAALAEGMHSGAGRLGLIETTEPVLGRPLTQRALRLATGELASLLSDAPRIALPVETHLERQAPANGTAFDEDRVVGALALLQERRLLTLRGPSRRALRQFALDLASHLGREAVFITPGDDLPPASTLLRLRDGLPVLDLCPHLLTHPNATARARALLGEVRRDLASGLVTLLYGDAEAVPGPALTVPRLDPTACRRVWQLSGRDAATGAALAQRYRINLAEVRAVVVEASDELRVRLGTQIDPSLDQLSRQVRVQGARRMGKQVALLRSAARLDQLVVPQALRGQIDDILSWYASSSRVFGDMKMCESSRLGRGLTCLFSGPPGTGKTFAAQCLANALDLNLYRIDLSQVVSKYIGETEKALATVFDEAEAGHGILLFDEADSLFGKRSAVKDAHDRYANIEVGFLLQRLEEFDGVAILATNLRNNLDPAFLRRMRFVLDFQMPDPAMRRRLWQQALPTQEFLVEGLDYAALSDHFRLSGGGIHNIGLAAAHLAAATESGCVTQEHLVRATYRELEKNGLSRTPAEFGDLAEWLPEAAS